MKVSIDGNEIRIKGKFKHHLKIYVSEEEGKILFGLSTLDGKFSIGNLPRIEMDDDNVIIHDSGTKKILI